MSESKVFSVFLCVKTSSMSCYRERIVFSTSGPWGNDGWTSVSSMWCLNAAPSRYMKLIHTETHCSGPEDLFVPLHCLLLSCDLRIYVCCVFVFSGSGVDPRHRGVLPVHTHLHRLQYPPHTGAAEGARGLPHHSQGWPHTHTHKHVTVCMLVCVSAANTLLRLSCSKRRSVWSCWSSWLTASARKATVTLGRSRNGWRLWTNATETSPCAWTSTAAAWRKLWASPRTPTRQ